MREPVILGLDISLSCTGWCLMSLQEDRVLAYGKVPTKALKKKKNAAKLPKGVYQDLGFFPRSKEVIDAVDAALTSNPGVNVVGIGVEQLNSFRGASTARTLAGVSKLLQHHLWSGLGVVPYEIHTGTAKLAFTGNGNAGKALTLVIANTHYKLKPPLVYYEETSKEHKAGQSDDDIADAISVAYALKKHLGQEILNALDK